MCMCEGGDVICELNFTQYNEVRILHTHTHTLYVYDAADCTVSVYCTHS